MTEYKIEQTHRVVQIDEIASRWCCGCAISYQFQTFAPIIAAIFPLTRSSGARADCRHVVEVFRLNYIEFSNTLTPQHGC